MNSFISQFIQCKFWIFAATDMFPVCGLFSVKYKNLESFDFCSLCLLENSKNVTEGTVLKITFGQLHVDFYKFNLKSALINTN